MKTKLLKMIRLRFDIRYLPDKILLIDHKAKQIEEYDTIQEATSYLIYTFCGMETHQEYVKKERFRKSLIKYYKTLNQQANGNYNSTGTKRNVTNSQIFS